MANGAEPGYLKGLAIIAAARHWATDNHDTDQLITRHCGNAEFMANGRRVVAMMLADEIGGLLK